MIAKIRAATAEPGDVLAWTHTLEVVETFAVTAARRTILRNVLVVRKVLQACGVINGVQWLGGSFVEQTALTRGRDPNDIDLVTYFGEHAATVYNELLRRLPEFTDPSQMQAKYLIDNYFEQFLRDQTDMLGKVVYWSNLFGHTQQNVRKGYLQVSLDPAWALDAEALTLLNSQP